jgi:hypothetical protein
MCVITLKFLPFIKCILGPKLNMFVGSITPLIIMFLSSLSSILFQISILNFKKNKDLFLHYVFILDVMILECVVVKSYKDIL